MCRRILQIHKIMNDKTPSYLKDKLPPKHRPFLFNVFRKIKCKTNRYMNNFFPRAISSWNIVISHFEVFPSSDSLKDHDLSLSRPKIKSIFGVHNPVGLRYLFQLRVRLRTLYVDIWVARVRGPVGVYQSGFEFAKTQLLIINHSSCGSISCPLIL